MPGATVTVKGTTIGAIADRSGRYSISVPGETTLVFSFVGSVPFEAKVSKSSELNVSLRDEVQQINDVIVTGYVTRERNTFTGAVTSISGEQLLRVSNTNLIQAITALTPGMMIVPNNAQGSNPNAIPEIIIRGVSTLVTDSNNPYVTNAPLVILDGVEISMEELYDLDIFDIERVDVLKDASATSLYGERGATGVIVIERNRVKESKIKLNYNFVPKMSYADLSSMRLTNAAEKLELERIAGIYTEAKGAYDEAYAYKLENVRKGVDTKWIEAPLRIAFSHNHSLQLSGGGQDITYRAALRLSDSYGIMKGDNRRNYGVTFGINYRTPEKITIGYSASVNVQDSRNTPYGTFSDYTKLNPYEPVYDEYGELIKKYYFDPINKLGLEMANPLYNATLSSFSKRSGFTFNNSLTARWDITKLFYVNGQLNLNTGKTQGDTYVSPDDTQYIENTDPASRGHYILNTSNNFGYDGKLMVNYRKMFGDGTALSFSGGGEFEKDRSNSARMTARGFLKDELSDIGFAMGYHSERLPSGGEVLSSRVGVVGNAHFVFQNRYFADISYRTSGSSKFGANNRWAPFWSYGVGWNIHKEKFLEEVEWIGTLRLRYSGGYTGSVNFSPYQAMTTYKYEKTLQYYTGIGANPVVMGNPDLKWQKTFQNNFGLNGSFFDNRLQVSFDYYRKHTTDQLLAIDLPPSVGETKVSVNFGETKNSGYDFSFTGQIIKKKDFTWHVSVTGGHVMDKIVKISNALKNTQYDQGYDMPKILFKDGGSQYDIYTMRSAGIDPATGQEIFIKKDGTYTFKYDSNERVAVGNTNPTLHGAISTNLFYKGFSLDVTMSYTFGSDMYNSTLYSKVENINPQANVDRRAYTDRWKEPGDLVRFLTLKSKTSDSYLSERFVERLNQLYISNITVSYQLPERFVKKLGMRGLVVGFGLSDVAYLSTVKYERGTSYPFERSLNLIFRPTF